MIEELATSGIKLSVLKNGLLLDIHVHVEVVVHVTGAEPVES